MRHGWWLMALGLVLGACSDDEPMAGGQGGASGQGGSAGAGAAGTAGAAGAGGGVDENVVDAPLDLDCDPLVPEFCGLPFPNNTWMIADKATPTGLRLHLKSPMMPLTANGVRGAPDDYADSDGFSGGASLLTYLPGATVTGLPTPLTLADSLKATSPTVLIDAETGERIPHFSELDATADPEEQGFMLRPVVRLKDATRYIVAIRNVVDASGKAIAASPAFAALRDRTASTEPAVQGRRGRFGKIFQALDKAGVDRASLQIAWDFTTASQANNVDSLLSMRDQALAAVGDAGPTYVIDDLVKDPSPTLAARIRGRFKVPLFLDKAEPGGRIHFDASGKPMQNGEAEFPFSALIPKVAETGDPAPAVWFGHGLLGSHTDVEAFDDVANDGKFALLASDWSGMASDDLDNLLDVLSAGDTGKFRTVTDRLQQSVVNALLLTRMGAGRLRDDPAVQLGGRPAIRHEDPYYFGASQGGILGATYMALTTDVQRGLLDVPGQSYNLLLQRSQGFAPFFILLSGVYTNRIDILRMLQLLQLHWDRVEPSGFSQHVLSDRLPGTMPHDVLMITSIGDHQVTTLGGHTMARAIGVKNLAPVNRDVFGLETVNAPYTGSALIEIDFGLPPEPITNVPMTLGGDPHGALRKLPGAVDLVSNFFRTGVIKGCGGPCKASL